MSTIKNYMLTIMEGMVGAHYYGNNGNSNH